MDVVQQSKAGSSSERVTPDMRWAMFWLFWLYYALSGFEVILAFQGRGDELGLAVAAFAVLTFIAGGLTTAACCARSDGVGLLVWVERFPDRVMQSAQLTGLVLLLAALFSGTPWGAGLEVLHDPVFMVGFGLTALALFCGVKPVFRRRRT